jgi:hypothetical protein
MHIQFPKSLDLRFDPCDLTYGVSSLSWGVSLIDLPLDSECAAPTYDYTKGLSMISNLFNFSFEIESGFIDILSVEIDCVECASL